MFVTPFIPLTLRGIFKEGDIYTSYLEGDI